MNAGDGPDEQRGGVSLLRVGLMFLAMSIAHVATAIVFGGSSSRTVNALPSLA